jgi:hypothetical protein
MNSFQRSLVSMAAGIANHDHVEVMGTLRTEQEGV